MSRQLPPLAALPAFEAAARLGNFTRAAEELHVTHGAISRAIARLEERLGVALFERHARHVSLTAAGRRLLTATDKAFDALESGLERLNRDDGPVTLSVSCEPSLAMRWLMPRLDHWRSTQPSTMVDLHTAGGPIDLQRSACDLAIRRLDFPRPDGVTITPLCPELAGPVCHPECWHEALGRDLSRARWLHSRTRPDAWAQWCRASETPYRNAGEQYYDHFYFTLQGAIDRLGTAIGPLPLVHDDLRDARLIAPFGMRPTGAEYVIISRESPLAQAPLQAFVDWLQQQAAPLRRLADSA
ncbi:LysR substrate-binding domain-containing protein [Modicisalibacter coralii]|uniref:LysR substrate-binding domain-containing protein n=1 Tax=Modicisalibacter coralii TaxID=2304602 RepID=UPI00100C19D7|nr:LysR substrate-binding domain-containing protein [Halomonas coralii]